MIRHRLISKLTGRTGWPTWRYIANKLVKYGLVVPLVGARASFRRLRGYQPKLDHQSILFIGGLHRSGTSLLHGLMRGHPNVSGIFGTTVPEDEGQHLQTVFEPDRRYGLLFTQHPDSHLTEESAHGTDDVRNRLLREWGRYWDFRKPVLVEKSPSNLVRMRFLQAVFPEARFLMIVRHPIAVTGAMEKWFVNKTAADALRHWFRAHQIMLSDMDKVRKCLVIRYEDLVTTPSETLDQSTSFIDLPQIDHRFDITDQNERYFAAWKAAPRLDDDSLKKLLNAFEPVLATFGYSMEPPYVYPGQTEPC